MSNITANQTAAPPCNAEAWPNQAMVQRYFEVFSFVLAAVILPYLVGVVLHILLYPCYQRRHLVTHSADVQVHFPPDVRSFIMLAQGGAVLAIVLLAHDYFDLTAALLLAIGVPVLLVLGWIFQGMIVDERSRRKFEGMFIFDGPTYEFSSREVNIVMNGVAQDVSAGFIHLWSETEGDIVIPLNLANECAIRRIPDGEDPRGVEGRLKDM